MDLCEVCGNEIVRGISTCKYCGSRQKRSKKTKSDFLQLRVNLELGKPVVELAMQKLSLELERAKREKVQLVTLIHGYGSSGKGGAIRRETRKTLDYLAHKGDIEKYIPGEEFSRRKGPVRDLLRRFPHLEKDENLNKNNRGITIVVLK